jgi:cytoskeletal protein RodZ
MLNKFADELKLQREKSGLSLQQLATKTRIDIKFLEAIDQGNFAFLPDLYVKAFVKQYAKTVGLDENLMLKKYETAKEGKEYDPNKRETEITNNELDKTEPPKQETAPPTPQLKSYVEDPVEKKSESTKKPIKQNILWLTAGAVAVVLFAIIYVFVLGKSDKIVVEETPIEEVVGQSSQRYEEQATKPISSDSLGAIINTDSLHLTFFAKETTWVFVVLDNSRTQEFTLNPDSKYSVAASNDFKVTVGNSGGVSMELNNQAVNFSGRSGSVRNFRLDKTGLIYLNAPPKIEK